MSNPEELFDIVDEHDVVIGAAPRGECHGNQALIHRAVHVLVFNKAGELLLQKHSPDKDIQPEKWDTSVGGHLDRGESYLAAAHREMAEGFGLDGLQLTFLYKSANRNETESENVHTYLTITENEIVFNRDEISTVRFWQHGEIEQSLRQGIFTPNFEEEWHMLQDYSQKYQSDNSGRLGCVSGILSPTSGRIFMPNIARDCGFAQKAGSNAEQCIIYVQLTGRFFPNFRPVI